jgi:isochorismate synthase
MDQAARPAEAKIVLARSLLLETHKRIDPMALWQRLAQDRSVTAFMTPLPASNTTDDAMLVGATPELLLKKAGSSVLSHPLAGSARRHPDASEDQQAAAQLLRSEKDLREHRHVVEAILDTLAPYCQTLHAPEMPSLRSTASMWHLGTRIEGVLRSPDLPCVELLRDLHPTPAVCGTPRDWARTMISRLESIDRGFFAGAVGWTQANGDGTWYVAIRCAELRAHQARLFAGAGIVQGSDPDAETRETAAKFTAMLQALQLEDSAFDAISSVA